jgi:DMSO/TMAO reductase YedYZ heme-binding membrane subunit
MSIILSLFAVTIFSLVFCRVIKYVPWLFYILAVAIAAAGIYFTYNPAPNQILRSIVFATQKGQVAFSLFAIVMFIGVFAKDSAVRRRLNPIRAELSIMAAILIVAHFVPYLSNYFSSALNLTSLPPSIISSLTIALIMLVLLVLLTVTSFNAIKKRMEAGHWKALQRFAYIFFALIFFHLLGYLAIPALGGSLLALLNMGIYAAVFLAYTVLRIRRALLDKKVSAEASGHLEFVT